MERHADPVTLDDLIRLRKENDCYLRTIDRYREALERIMLYCEEPQSDNKEYNDMKLGDIWEIAADSLGIRPVWL